MTLNTSTNAPYPCSASTWDAYAILDTETVPDRHGRHRIVEIAVDRYDPCADFGPIYESLVDPGLTGWDDQALERLPHGLTPAAVLGAPRFQSIAGLIDHIIQGTLIVAHGAAFDRRVLADHRRRSGRRPLPNAWMCSLALARRLEPDLPSHSLEALTRHFGVPHRRPHRAGGDVEATGAVLAMLLRRHAHRPELPALMLAATWAPGREVRHG